MPLLSFLAAASSSDMPSAAKREVVLCHAIQKYAVKKEGEVAATVVTQSEPADTVLAPVVTPSEIADTAVKKEVVAHGPPNKKTQKKSKQIFSKCKLFQQMQNSDFLFKKN